MDDADGGFSFDFEGGLDTSVVPSNAPSAVAVTGSQVISTVAAAGVGTSNGVAAAAGALQSGRRNYRQTVCRHWLRGLCMKGDACGFLHQLDRSRMPVCRFFSRYGECHEPDCVYKHTYEDIKECNMYKMGFCPNGPDCRYRHIKLPGPFPSLEESLQKIQVRTTGRQYGRHTSQRQGVTGQDGTQIPSLALPSSQPAAGTEDVQNVQAPPQAPAQEAQKHQQELPIPVPPPSLLPTPAQRILGSEQQVEAGQNQAWQQVVANVPGNHVQATASTPLPQGYSRYFIVKSSNRENLELSVARGLWATHRNNESKLNEAFDSCDNVILIFSVNETGHFQGCARMMSKIGVIVGGGGWKYAHGTAHYGRNFRLKWLKLSELSFNKTRHLRNPYKENLPVKISRDCQELEPTVGEQLASLLYMEPDSELMKIANEAELKWEEDKAEGGQELEDTTGVPFDVVEEDQEEEESDDEDSSNQTAGASKHISTGRGSTDSADASRKKGRGRGRNGTGELFAVGYERFTSPGNGLIKLPGAAPGRGFPTYPSLPRFGGHVAFGAMDGAVLAPGMVLSGRPPSNGLFVHGMMGPPGAAALIPGVRPTNIMAASRPPFLGVPGQHGRPGTMPFRPPQVAGWVRRDQQVRRQKNENYSVGERLQNVSDPRSMDKSVERDPANGEQFGLAEGETDYSQLQEDADFAGESYGKDDDDSLSEDEAPRRSRHGEARKRRRD